MKRRPAPDEWQISERNDDRRVLIFASGVGLIFDDLVSAGEHGAEGRKANREKD